MVLLRASEVSLDAYRYYVNSIHISCLGFYGVIYVHQLRLTLYNGDLMALQLSKMEAGIGELSAAILIQMSDMYWMPDFKILNSFKQTLVRMLITQIKHVINY